MPESELPVSTADATHTTITQNWVAPTDIYSIQLEDVTLGNISTVNTVLSLYDPSTSSYKEVSFSLVSNGNITELQIMYGPEKFDSSGVRLVIEDNDIAFFNIDGMIRHTGYGENGATVTHTTNDTFLEVDLVTSIVNELEIDIAVDDLTDLEYWDANTTSWLAISFGAGHKSTDDVGSNTILLLATGIDASRLRLTFSTGQAITPAIVGRQFSSKTANFGVSYIYDAMGRRVARLYDNITGKGNERGVYDGYQLIEERKLESNQLLKRFYYSSAVNGLILNEVDLNDDGVIDETNDGIYVPICDDRGSLVGVSDGTGSPNNIIERIYYNSTGIMRVFDGAGVIKKDSLNRDLGRSEFISFGWAGMYQEEFGLYHTHYREYDALHRRWLSEDPAGTVDGINLYAMYSSVNSVDLLGDVTILIHGVDAKGDYFKDAEKELRAAWKKAGKDHEQAVIHFSWGRGSKGAGKVTMPKKWDATDRPPAYSLTPIDSGLTGGGNVTEDAALRLTYLIKRIKAKFPNEPINIIAHSQGTIITAQSMKKHGTKFDNIVFLGSPGDAEYMTYVLKDLQLNYKKLYNYYSDDDDVTGILTGGGRQFVKKYGEWKNLIGVGVTYELPNSVKQFNLAEIARKAKIPAVDKSFVWVGPSNYGHSEFWQSKWYKNLYHKHTSMEKSNIKKYKLTKSDKEFADWYSHVEKK